MANASISRLVLLFFTVVLVLVMVHSEARSYDHGMPTVAEKIDSMAMLEKLGYDLSKVEYYRRMLSGSPERISPGGPDPEHHV
ncbi:CLAVATA3/ESR-RELATED 6 [Hibiscus trionum]|uniref:CLAVATA3/ESR-RELATED 6 n=1 Tax=Hibiscus trionum TaxID=183268 RepID=A0A9W7JA79_HIBTR|nr:CLAVATA3/ESR-RELATED 6 [Hibiscus trionum]